MSFFLNGFMFFSQHFIQTLPYYECLKIGAEISSCNNVFAVILCNPGS